jgi:hypothetical protein
VSELLGCEIERKGIDAGKSEHIAELVTRWKNVAGQGQKEVSSIVSPYVRMMRESPM